MTNTIPPSVVEILQRPLPPEAIKPHPVKPYLSTINAIYVTDRMNEAFGTGEWKLNIDVIDGLSKMKTVKVKFTVPKYEIELEQFGGNDNVDAGDAFKGATTDALTKIGSYLGIGADVWKNKSPKKSNDNIPEWDTQATEQNEKALSDKPKCQKCGADMAISKSTGKPFCSSKCWLK